MTNHENYIKRCIAIAKNGLGSTRPNPMVGCVIVYKGNIIGEGFTSAYGGNHAEVNAINSVVNKDLLKETTLYVTLEPCSHYGKTPPCSDLIIKHKIPNVVIGCIDDHIKVAGKGIEKLKQSGSKVTVGVLANECREHHKRFFTFHNKKRPYIILKWAETADGFIAPLTKDEKKPVWISNAYSRQLTHKWRTEEQAILVGSNTVIQDNPTLTARDWTGKNPIRVLTNKTDNLSKNYNIFNDQAETIVLSSKDSNSNQTYIDWDSKSTIAQQICNVLYKKNINSIIIEGGLQTLQSFINENLWDEARVFTGNMHFHKGIKAPNLKGRLMSQHIIMSDLLKLYKND
ncbi:bifunctional diaminohydroxyphosphoribosylaminopyrimidine deaminase/5-amino-6-(5-phosphoribosylamino)uracil reductase RibD [Snuella sedimenti]|uniref:Riboflavin biosynthesis protein RibD n=1 Tax=Snuella sedimenti TaxID=2798802 RepID=A0A8J7J3D0_9FLAO|nr:bifunctional diaminohydroxyphosphoribosylaminopyrimidine deaminase/5-amino-6-(5-phosphoribosylamino)uracil reductase RibD [Snuella sedimenti]MBJ6369007.1 bifunctional diaminohydroxyphosphoribosylaminopyrimidine deaminase/5-amino-6-(5-phosphoribosylamino)uracil reductase RibD [Snuella sedimenti]